MRLLFRATLDKEAAGGGGAMGLGGIGMSELVVILLIALLIFGPSRLADIGSSLGKAVRDFRKSMQDEEHRGS